MSPRVEKTGVVGAAQAESARAGRSGPRYTSRLALSKHEAARSLGISVDTLERHVMPEVRVVRIGESRQSRVVIPMVELERYLDRHAALPVGGVL